MIEQDVVDAFNARPKVDPNNIKTMSPSEQDKVKVWGSQAENLLKNREFAMFVHQFKFEMTDALTEIRTYSEQDNNEISGIDNFITMLKRAMYYKNKVVSLQQGKIVEDPNL